jgi:hypothetical protein
MKKKRRKMKMPKMEKIQALWQVDKEETNKMTLTLKIFKEM